MTFEVAEERGGEMSKVSNRGGRITTHFAALPALGWSDPK